jgi:uncharacterized sporulation protein YeaH/YhbH (DUF444 family)
MNLLKIPKFEECSTPTAILGVIDCSGSMEMYWEWVAQFWNTKIPKDGKTITITFDTTAKIVGNNTLNAQNIMEHGGGGTSIPEAFLMMEKVINERIPVDQPLTLIFISDGDDSNMKTINDRMKKLKGNLNRYINFICLGRNTF